MELNNIPSVGKWSEASGGINENFNKTNIEIEKLKYTLIKGKGYFTTEESLRELRPNPSSGDHALVGTPFPGTVYAVNESGEWYNTGEVPSVGEIDLAEYAKLEDLELLGDKLKSTIAAVSPYPDSSQTGVYVNKEGSLVASTATREIRKYNVNTGEIYTLNCTELGSAAWTVALYGKDGFIKGLFEGSQTEKQHTIEIPANATELVVSFDNSKSYSFLLLDVYREPRYFYNIFKHKGKYIENDGSLNDTATQGRYTSGFLKINTLPIRISGTVAAATTVWGYFYDKNFMPISSLTSATTGQPIDVEINSGNKPENAVYYRIFGDENYKTEISDLTASTSVQLGDEGQLGEYSEILPSSIETGKYVSNAGIITSTLSPDRAIVRYPASADKQYLLDCTAIGLDAATITFWGDSGFLGGLLPGDMTRKRVKFFPPYEETTEIVVSPNTAYLYSLSESSYTEIKRSDNNTVLTFEPLSPSVVTPGVYINKSGSVVSSAASGRGIVRYKPIDANKEYILNCTTIGSDAATITFFDEDGVFLGWMLQGDQTEKRVKFSVPYENTAEIIISPNTLYGYSLSSSDYTEIRESEGVPITFKPQIKNNTLPVKNVGDTIKILFLGSSWGEDTHYLVPKVFAASGINAIIGGCLISGGTFQMYVDAWKNNTNVLFRYSENGEDWVQAQVTLSHAIEKQDWDIIVFQQNAADSFYWDKYQPGMKSLLEILKLKAANRRVCFALNQTWTPAPSHMAQYGFNDQRKMYEASLEANNNAAQATGIDVIIPCGMAVYALRSSSKTSMNDMTWDGVHLDNGVGYYLTACTVFEALIGPIYGLSVYGNTFRTENPFPNYNIGTAVTDNNAYVIQECAMRANANRYDFPDASDL